MSDLEFDNYLTLLAGLLSLDGRQRQQIAKELQAHLDDRLDELIAQGVPHEQAVQQALAEFGDAAGLAASFGKVSRGRKRRWLMRVTTFSIAATILIAAGIFTFWPGRNAAPGVAAVIAQAPDPFLPAGEQPSKPLEVAPKAKPAAEAAPKSRSIIEAELNKATTIEFVETPLGDVAAFLQETHQIPILLKTKKLDEAGVSVDTPITKKLHGVKLATALGHILEELDLVFVVQDELLLITTPADAESRLEIRVYDCRDLLASRRDGKALLTPRAAAGSEGAGGYGGGMAMPGMGYGEGGYGEGGGAVREHDQRAQRLMSIVTTNVDDQSWQFGSAGAYGGGYGGEMAAGEQPKRGRGMISEYDGLIVVTQTAQTHRKIEQVLDMLRRAAGLEIPDTGKVVR